MTRRSRATPMKQELAEMNPDSDAMDAIQAAAFLGVHVETLRKLARRNEIPSFKVGRDCELLKHVPQYAPLMILAKPVKPELLERTVRMAMGVKPAKGATA